MWGLSLCLGFFFFMKFLIFMEATLYIEMPAEGKGQCQDEMKWI